MFPLKPKIHIVTFGCQMNEHDSERMAGLLVAEGFSYAANMDDADMVLINSCTIRQKAEEKAFSQAGRINVMKRDKPHLKIGFCGCVAQREKHEIFRRAPYIDLVFGTLNIPKLPFYVKRLFQGEERICQVSEDPIFENYHYCSALRSNPVKAWITIMEGCNNFCTYCVVPYVRGRERSRTLDDILNEVRFLAESGYKEVTLLGQNVNSYGKGLAPSIDFAGLLYRLDQIPGLERIRFTTSHPKDLSADLIQAMKSCEKVCEHIHLPIQSGSDAVLEKMGRGYTVKEYLSKVEALRESIPEIAITSDMICGFPGESERDFEQTLKVMEIISFDGLFSFKYSQRPQTLASQLPEQVPERVKTERLARLQMLQNAISTQMNTRLAGTVQPLLIEGTSKRATGKLTGRTRTNKLTHLTGPSNLIGKIVKVKIIRSKPFDLEAERVK